MINNVGLKYFIGVARSGSIRRAAEQLHVAASAISRQIQMLEEELNAELFERHRGQKSLRLTAAGELLLNYTRLIENELDQVRADIRAIDTLQKGTVRLGASESFSREFLPSFLHRFHSQYPGITFNVIVGGGGKLVELLAKDEIDVALAYRAPDAFDVQVIAETHVTPCLLVSATHPFANRRSVDIEECGEIEIALPDESLTIRESYVRMFSKARIRPRTILVTNSFELMRAAAVSGLCNAIVNKYFGNYKVPRGLRYVPLHGEGVERWPLRLCVHTGRSLPVSVKLFIEQLQAEMDAVDESRQ
ncbi:LysR family transcriptional regulator [Paraburkholderia phymatum]|uniref:Transcriptional regulator, LysR family n=1 Tax=Paraburkholderia phymatum (strain DSM 17167 / CIP 108236 / LMG 21445 / STM815) TaxID=391038 RepID=B2JRL2_PARP8|nr:LysR substrate-binding domain-containing protein [Paraburkholderia phymatum]ACC72339.1 transcriptional regulator, LysR family [Paraburkholderia phymatum STM815]